VKAEPRERLRELPAVDQLVRAVEHRAELHGIPRARLTACAREVLDAERRRALAGTPAELDAAVLATRVVEALARGVFSLGPVINATGVVLHTALGRAVLSPLALERLSHWGRVLQLGDRPRREEARLPLQPRGGAAPRLTGAEDALVVNNNAAAVLLALESLARGREVIVSRGELIEIGGEFRIPDIMVRGGAVLREVGTTNRTHLADYADAIGPDTALLLKVHPSNYRVVGFAADVPTRDLVELGRERTVPVMEDLGSGSLVDLRAVGLPWEPTVQEVVASGVDLVLVLGRQAPGRSQAGCSWGAARSSPV